MSGQDKQGFQFYITSPQSCPYLPDQQERKVFTYLTHDFGYETNSILTQNGFRRSQNIIYRPACENCSSCVSVRILVDSFKPNKRFRRILAKNIDIISDIVPVQTTSENYALFHEYVTARHQDGGMANMTLDDFQTMVEKSYAQTYLVEYRKRDIDHFLTGKSDGPLVATSLTDVVEDGLSMVYSFYSIDAYSRSLGSYMILDHIEKTRQLGLPYLYLGFWIKGSNKMDYKRFFFPQERLGNDGWKPFMDHSNIENTETQ